jgi:hypothetical protein
MISEKQISVNFIAGMGRSGTTLLLSMLNSVEQNLCIPEIPIALYLYHSHKKRTNFNSTDVSKLLSLKSKLNYIRHVTIDEGYFKTQVNECKSYKQFIETSYLTTVDPSKKVDLITNIIDKNPIYTYYPKTLSAIFPKSKFILMVRNPFGYVNSCLESNDPGKRKRRAEFYALAYRNYAHEINNIQKKFKNQSLIVHYENLVSQPEKTLQSICDFLNIDFNFEMLDFYNKTYNIKYREDSMDHSQEERIKFKYGSLSQPVNTNRIESWRKNLTQHEIDVIDSITALDAEKFGYQVNFSKTTYSFHYFKSKLLVKLYFLVARYFYFLPRWFREIFRIKV